MKIGRVFLSLVIGGFAAAALLAGITGAQSDDETSVSEGTIKNMSVALEGGGAGTVYFDIEPTEAGSPSSFKVDARSIAAVQLLSAARAAGQAVRITHKSDFAVTGIEF